MSARRRRAVSAPCAAAIGVVECMRNQVLVETTEAQRVTDINIARRFEPVAQHAVHQKFVLVGADAGN